VSLPEQVGIFILLVTAISYGVEFVNYIYKAGYLQTLLSIIIGASAGWLLAPYIFRILNG